MTEHAWSTEYVDAGVVDGTFWKCPTCGVGAGPVWERAEGLPERWPAFIPGAGRNVSEDCEEAQAQIRSFVLDERIVEMRKRWCAPQAEIIDKAVRASPEVKNLMPVIELIFEIINPRVKGYCMPIVEAPNRLREMGFSA
jgi:hypothetical protein